MGLFGSGSYSPYQIHIRYKEGAHWSDIAVHAHYLPLRHSSLDFSHGEDTLSLCYEDSSSGNLEATFGGATEVVIQHKESRGILSWQQLAVSGAISTGKRILLDMRISIVTSIIS